MKHIDVIPKSGFNVLGSSRLSQAAIMVLGPGESTGGKDNKHDKSDQWLYIRSGTGKAIIEEESVSLQTGSLILIEAGETHEIKNTGNEPLDTLNFYAPPEY